MFTNIWIWEPGRYICYEFQRYCNVEHKPEITFAKHYHDEELIRKVTQSSKKGGEVFDLKLAGEEIWL